MYSRRLCCGMQRSRQLCGHGRASSRRHGVCGPSRPVVSCQVWRPGGAEGATPPARATPMDRGQACNRHRQRRERREREVRSREVERDRESARARGREIRKREIRKRDAHKGRRARERERENERENSVISDVHHVRGGPVRDLCHCQGEGCNPNILGFGVPNKF